VIDTVVEVPISGHSLARERSGGNGSGKEPVPAFFLAGPENRLAGVVVDSILGGGSPVYNPVVLVGPPGSGKSHLAAGLVGTWRQRFGQRRAVYVPAVDFAREWTDAIETQATEEFHSRYRRAELVAIDDMDVLVPKPAVQQELLHTIDALGAAGGRLVLTSTSTPGLIAGLLPALQSRLVGGLVVPLALPSRETRLAAVARFSQLRAIDLAEDAAALLADGLPGPLSALWAAVLHLGLSAQLDAGKAPEHRVREYLARLTTAPPSLRDIAAATARHFSLRLTDLRSVSRRRAVVVARDVAMYLARTLTGKSFKQIGMYFNGRDHSTVSHGCWKTAELLKTDLTLRSAVDQLRQQIHAA
jgi:chromosomal replication initiator protein